MSWLVRMEETCAAFIERTFAKTFPSDLEPAQIARKLVATMEARTEKAESGMHAPSIYVVRVHPADFERLSPHSAYLQREWAALLLDLAQRVGIAFTSGDPAVRLAQDAGVVAGAVEIDAQRVADPPEAPEPRAHAGGLVLRMIKGVPPNAVYPINAQAKMTVGRNADQHIALMDPGVSRSHAVIESDDRGLMVHDLGSTNGTFVNDERVEKARLKAGDSIAFGKTRMRVEESDS